MTKEINTLTDKQEQIEKIGVVFERTGMPSVAARIIGLLLVAEPPYKTSDEIVEEINVSKSSVNNTIKLLQSEGLITYTTFPGDRKRYFKFDPHTWVELIKHRIKILTPVREILQETVEMRSDQYPEFNQHLIEVSELYFEFQKGALKIIDDWEKKKEKNS